MSHISRTRSAAAGIEAPAGSSGLLTESVGNAAAAAKTRHSGSRLSGQEAKSQVQQLSGMPAGSTQQCKKDDSHTELLHQGSVDENALAAQPDKMLKDKIKSAADDGQLPSDSHAARTRSLPPRPKPARTRSAKPAPAKPVQTAALAERAEHALPAGGAMPAAHPLSTTLAGIAQSLVAFGSHLHTASSDLVEETREQIDIDMDDSDDSDFQPDKEPAAADDDIINLSQEDPLDVVEHLDGSFAIRSPLQAAAVAAVDLGEDDDEEEFQQLQGKGKRKQTAKLSAAGMHASHARHCIACRHSL